MPQLQQSSTKPFFSIVIPTKNRSFLVKYALQSLLWQTFTDFEVILVDNDDTDETYKVVSSFKDERIKYFRTGKLSMPDNWEFGLNKANGKYIAILEDKMVVKKRSLDKIKTEIEKTDAPVVTWMFGHYNDVSGFYTPDKNATGKIKLISSKRILQSFMDCDLYFFADTSPRGFNSCCHNKVFAKIQRGPFGRICLPACPDYTMAFQQLAVVDNILNIEDALVILGSSLSNGRDFIKKGTLSKKFIEELGWKESDLYNHVPIKIRGCRNATLNDFFRIKPAYDKTLSDFSLNIHKYFLCIYDEILLAQNWGVDMSIELKGWYKALCNQDDFMKKDILDGIKPLEAKYKKNKNNRQYIKGILKTIFIKLVGNNIWENIRLILKNKSKPKTKYTSILEYLKQEP